MSLSSDFSIFAFILKNDSAAESVDDIVESRLWKQYSKDDNKQIIEILKSFKNWTYKNKITRNSKSYFFSQV